MIMKKNTSPAIAVGISVFALCLFVGFNASSQPGGTVVSAERNSFKEVTSRLDPGGDLYLYLSTSKMLEGLSAKIAQFQGVFNNLPNVNAEQRELIGKVFTVVTNLVKDSGIEEVTGLGMSGIAVEKGFYRTKVFVHHYPSQGSGFLWKIGGEKVHALDGLNLLPATTAMATFSDLDLGLLWTVIQQHVDQADIPQAKAFLDKLPENFEKFTGLNWQKVLASLGGEYGFVITLDESKMIPVPLPTSEKLEIPEPAIMIVVKVKDNTIYDRVAEVLKQHEQQVVTVDKPDLKMLTVPVPLPLPIQLRPSIATSGGYLFVATTDALIQQALGVKEGKSPGLKSTDEFKKLARGIPEKGNQFTFVSQRFGQTLVKAQEQFMAMNPRVSAAERRMIQSMIQPKKAVFSYSVSGNTDEGWLTVGNGNRQPAEAIAAAAVMVPAAMVGMASAIAIPNFIKARKAAQRTACIYNLRQIEAAKKQWALDNGKKDGDVPTRSDLEPYLSHGFPTCPQGGHYTIGPVGQEPTCSIPGHSLPD